MWPTRIIFFLFVISGPIGVIVGSVITDSIYDFALLIIQSFSAGTFVYLGAVDLIVHEFFSEEVINDSKKMKAIKLFSVFVGWVFIILLVTFLDAHEDHEEH
jgi:zinc transporter ZupT